MRIVAEAESSDNGVGVASEAAVSQPAPADRSSQAGSAEEPQISIRRHSSNKLFLSHEFYSHFALPDSEPQNILERIVWYKEVEVDRMRNMVPMVELQRRLRDENPYPARNFLGALRNAATTDGKVKPALIAEVKKASPSKGVLREDFDPVEIGRAYEAAGASCMSVLTDKKFFQGGFENLKAIREEIPEIPLLCKDFILYPYQLYVARLNGADAVLLIAAVLKDIDMQYFLKIAKAMRMTCLIEVHTLEEMDRVLSLDGVELIGINNRNLESFRVDLANTESIMAARLDQIKERGILVVSESGIHKNGDLQRVQASGCSAVLIGESLVTKPDPAAAIRELFQSS